MKSGRNNIKKNIAVADNKKNNNHRRGRGGGEQKKLYQPAVGLTENREREPMVDVSGADKSFRLPVAPDVPGARTVAELSEVARSGFPSAISTKIPESKEGQRPIKTSVRSP